MSDLLKNAEPCPGCGRTDRIMHGAIMGTGCLTCAWMAPSDTTWQKRTLPRGLMEALELAHKAIIEAIALEDGLDGAVGEDVLMIIERQLDKYEIQHEKFHIKEAGGDQ